MLNIKIKGLLKGTKEAEGIAILIDIFRAGTNIALALSKGAKEVIPIESLEESLQLMSQHPDYIFMGERDGIKVPQFHFGNSCYEIDQGNFDGKIVSINTTAGSKGILNAEKADQVIIGGFANSPAIEEYIQKEYWRLYDGTKPITVTIVPLGWACQSAAFEDCAYAKYLKDRLVVNPAFIGCAYNGTEIHRHEVKIPSYEAVTLEILQSTFVKHTFLNPKNTHFREEDLPYCLTLGMYNVVPKVFQTGQGPTIRNTLTYNPNSP